MLIMAVLFIGPGLLIPIDGSMMRPCRERNREGISRVDAVTVQPLTGTSRNPDKTVKCHRILQAREASMKTLFQVRENLLAGEKPDIVTSIHE